MGPRSVFTSPIITMKALSMDLRERILSAYENGEGSQAALARRFGVGKATVERLLRLKRQTGSVKPRPHGGGRKPLVKEEHHPKIEAWLKDHPDLTYEELAQRFKEETGIGVSGRTMGRVLERMGYTRKKRL